MSAVTWINPEVKGSCSTAACGVACCKFRIYTDAVNYTLEWCEYFQQDSKTCGIYATRPEGCRRYPDIRTFLKEKTFPGCTYYLEEAIND